MLTIKRNCSYQIITRAVHADGKPLVALLMPNADDCEPCLDQDQLQASLDANPQAIIVYNQQPAALALVEKLITSEELRVRALEIAEIAVKTRWACVSETHRTEVLGQSDPLPPGLAA